MAFFLLTYLLSWGCWILVLAFFREAGPMQLLLLRVGAFSPALVAIALAAALDPRPCRGSPPIRRVLFMAVWVLTSIHLVLFLNVLEDWTLGPGVWTAIILSCTLPAYVLSRVLSGNRGVRSLLGSLTRPGGHWAWYLVAVVLVPVALATGILVEGWTGAPLPEPPQTLATVGWSTVLLEAVTETVQAGGLAEEPGWRGFALTRLQQRMSPLRAGLLVGVLWVPWHGPLLWQQFVTAGPIPLVLNPLLLGVLFAWIYNRSGGGLLAVVLFHGSWNTALTFLSPTTAFRILMVLLATMVVIHDRMWLMGSHIRWQGGPTPLGGASSRGTPSGFSPTPGVS